MTSSFFFFLFKECIYTFNHAFFSGRPLSHSFPLCFLLMGIGFPSWYAQFDLFSWETITSCGTIYVSFLVCTHFDLFSTSIISHAEIFLWQLYMTSLWEGLSSLSVTQTSLPVNNNIGEYNLFYNYYTIFFYRRNLGLVLINVVNIVPYRLVRPEYTIPAGNPVWLTPMFRTGRNTGRTGKYRLYRPVFEYRTKT